MRLGNKGQPIEVIRPVLTVQEVCRLLKRSQRQIYRYVKAGRLRACARVLGQWLFSADEVRLFRLKRVPKFLRPFFWDVRLADLSPEHHRSFILARLLESGDRRAVDWMFKTYPRQMLLSFLDGRGQAVLSKRARHFWSSLLGARAGRFSQMWRRQGRRWGGIA